jgi:hypothetical protein
MTVFDIFGSLLRYVPLGGAFEEFVDVGLVGLGLFDGEAAELREDARGDADGD